MSHAVINGDKVVPPCTVSRASAQSEQRGGGRGELEGAEGALVLGYGHGVRGPTVAVRTHAQIAPPCTASRASAQSEQRGGRRGEREGGRLLGGLSAVCEATEILLTERRGSGRCGRWAVARTFSVDARRVGNVWVALPGHRHFKIGNARAGWLGAVSCDSDTAPDRRGPRKDAALAGYSRKSTPWA